MQWWAHKSNVKNSEGIWVQSWSLAGPVMMGQWCSPLDSSVNVLITSSFDISEEKLYIFLNIQLTKLKLISVYISGVFLDFIGAACCRSQQVALVVKGMFSLPRS